MQESTTNWIVRRWARFGHERLYAETPGGTALGYYDLTTGTFHADEPSDLPLLTRAIDDHLGAHAPTAPTPTTEEPVEATAADTPAVWRDLSTNTPGQAARDQAAEAWRIRKETKPVRAVLGRLLNIHTDERAWRIGAAGEEAVGNQLDKLARKDPRWRVLHAVPVGERGSDIDHLVIGPAGVFTINTKHHPRAKIWVGKDQLRVNGHTQPYIRNSRFEARRASKLLSSACGFDVRSDALLIFYAVDDITMKTSPGERDGSRVHIKFRRQAIRWLKNQPRILTDQQIDQIYDQARRSTTWA